MSDHCPETRNRIKVALAAYAYEIENDPIMSDSDFDSLALSVNPEVKTGNKELDRFFVQSFEPHTGKWVHEHPGFLDLAHLAKTLGKRLRVKFQIEDLI